jgi:hypothetical protein
VYAHLKYFAHHIQSSPLWSSEKQPVQYTQSASSSVKLSSKGTARSASRSDGVSDGVGARQTLLFHLFEEPSRAFDASCLVLDLVPRLIFFFWVAPTNFFKVNSLFSLLFCHECLAVGPGLAHGWYLMLGYSQQKWTVNTNRTAYVWLKVFTKAGWFTGATSVSSEARGKSCGLEMFL